MISKRSLHHYHSKLRLLKPKVLIAMVLLSAFITAVALRSNNVQMLRLREAVFAADERGEGVEESLNELRNYVYAHMNTDLNSGGVSIKPPIQLKNTYERLIDKEKTKIEQKNKQTIAEAPGICESQFGAGQILARAACVDDYIAKNTLKSGDTVPKELYQFDFASPSWSPDFAGIMLIVTLVLMSLLFVRLVLGAFFVYELH